MMGSALIPPETGQGGAGVGITTIVESIRLHADAVERAPEIQHLPRLCAEGLISADGHVADDRLIAGELIAAVAQGHVGGEPRIADSAGQASRVEVSQSRAIAAEHSTESRCVEQD